MVRVIRRARVSGVLAELIQRIQSRRPMGVRFLHNVFASWEAVRTARRSAGTVGSGSGPKIASFTVSPTSAPAPLRMALFTRSYWPPDLLGSSAARKG